MSDPGQRPKADKIRPSGNPGLDDRGRMHLQLSYLSLAEERLGEAALMIRHAEKLGPLQLRHSADQLRQRSKGIEKEEALGALASLLHQAESLLSPQRFLKLIDFFLESEGLDEDPIWIEGLADLALERLHSLMGCPGADSRQVREDCQASLEKALAALLQAAKRTGDGIRSGQQLMAKAWTLVMACRNPELQSAAKRLPLCDGLIKPPRQGASLAFFLFRNLFQDAALLVLANHRGRFSFRLLAQAQSRLIPQFLDWGQRLATPSTRASGPLPRREPSVEAAESERSADDKASFHPGLDFQQLLPSELADHPGFPFAGPWNLFPEGIFHALPLEMLADGEDQPWGQNREVRICLSDRPQKRTQRRAQWSRGWLAVADVPAPGQVPELEGSLDEVLALKAVLSKESLPAEVLSGPRAHLSNLKGRLKDSRPGVLHLAVHSHCDESGLEACALVLATVPGVAQSELLTFGLIHRMDLSHLDLVVLSASSGPGGGTPGAPGIEGLAWAFLRAGAAQVIARRYPVDRQAGRLFLLSLYRQLLKHPAALALGHARYECLRRLGLGPQQVGAWSVWN